MHCPTNWWIDQRLTSLRKHSAKRMNSWAANVEGAWFDKSMTVLSLCSPLTTTWTYCQNYFLESYIKETSLFPPEMWTSIISITQHTKTTKMAWKAPTDISDCFPVLTPAYLFSWRHWKVTFCFQSQTPFKQTMVTNSHHLYTNRCIWTS